MAVSMYFQSMWNCFWIEGYFPFSGTFPPLVLQHFICQMCFGSYYFLPFQPKCTEFLQDSIKILSASHAAEWDEEGWSSAQPVGSAGSLPHSDTTSREERLLQKLCPSCTKHQGNSVAAWTRFKSSCGAPGLLGSSVLPWGALMIVESWKC